MKEVQFINIFINPLDSKKIHLKEIDKDTYHEVKDLTNRFLIPNHVLKNILYDNKSSNYLIQSLKEQLYVSNLNSLINKESLLNIAKSFNENKLEYVFMKGSAINLMNDDYVRYSRDIDILVKKNSVPEAYNLLKRLGYRYKDPLVSDKAKYFNHSHQIPILSNKDGSLVEIHHRVTQNLFFKECPLTESMISNHRIIQKNGVDIKISEINHLITHITYHASLHHKYDLGPIFLYDIKFLINKIKDEKNLFNLLSKVGLRDEYSKIIRYLESKNKIKDTFNIYNKVNTKIFNYENPKKFKHLLFSKKGILDFIKIISRKFTYNQDLFQTSKYSFKYYLILLIQLKNHIFKLLKS